MNYASPGMAGHMPQTPEDEERGYVLKPWKGFPRYACIRCPYEFGDEGMARLHWAAVHVQQAALERLNAESRPASVRLFDAKGELVERIPITPDTPELPTAKPEEEEAIPEFLIEQAVRDLEKKGLLTYGADDVD